MNCSSIQEQLPALIYGDLSPEEAGQVEGHLRDCPACRHEKAGLEKVQGFLGALEHPAVSVDLPLLYRQAAVRQERRFRVWRRLAAVGLGAAAAILLITALARLEVRWQPDQVVLRWGPLPVAPPNPNPALSLERVAEAAAKSSQLQDLQDQLYVLSELVQGVATEGEARYQLEQEQFLRLGFQIEDLKRRTNERLKSTERDVAGLAANPWTEPKKGTIP